ncbi:MAG: hypothetical protein JXN10_03170 [Clostridia bacterium]|nr:hypothetical protein [Clostridia bacterium]MBN2882502.1 hypothetical protein [Clostridia bacterium]
MRKLTGILVLTIIMSFLLNGCSSYEVVGTNSKGYEIEYRTTRRSTIRKSEGNIMESLYMPVTEETLLNEHSDYIGRGKVRNVETAEYRIKDSKVVKYFSIITIDVMSSIKGNQKQNDIIKVYSANSEVWPDEGAVELIVGNEYIFFLKKNTLEWRKELVSYTLFDPINYLMPIKENIVYLNSIQTSILQNAGLNIEGNNVDIESLETELSSMLLEGQ